MPLCSGFIGALVDQGEDRPAETIEVCKVEKFCVTSIKGIKEAVNVLDKGIHGPRCDAQIDTSVAKVGHENSIARASVKLMAGRRKRESSDMERLA